MSDQDENETLAPVFGVLAGVILGVIALVAGIGIWKVNQAGESAKPVIVAKSGETDIAPVGDALAKLYFAVGKAELEEGDKVIVAKALEEGRPGIVRNPRKNHLVDCSQTEMQLS